MTTVTIGHIPVLLGIAATASYCLYMHEYVLMHFRFVSSFKCTESSSLLPVCLSVCGLAVPWPRCHWRRLSDFHVGELALDDTVMAPCWAASFICCHANWPSSTAHIEDRGGKEKFWEKPPSGRREKETSIHEYAHPTEICFLLL